MTCSPPGEATAGGRGHSADLAAVEATYADYAAETAAIEAESHIEIVLLAGWVVGAISSLAPTRT